MYYSKIKYFDISNGYGIRVSLFVSGCTHRCKGCFNKETWDRKYGKVFDQNAFDSIIKFLEREEVAGLTVLGGEPLDYDNPVGLYDLVTRVKNMKGKNIWLYTGYVLEDFLKDYDYNNDTHFNIFRLLNKVDVLVDGPFIQELSDLSLQYRGSANQRVINLPKTLEGMWVNGKYNPDAIVYHVC